MTVACLSLCVAGCFLFWGGGFESFFSFFLEGFFDDLLGFRRVFFTSRGF